MSAPAPAPSPPPAEAAPDPAPSPPAGAAAEPVPVELTEFFCYDCESSISLPVRFAHPMAIRPPCPLCNSTFIEPGPSPFPPEPEPPLLPLPPQAQELLHVLPEGAEDPLDFAVIEEPEDVDAMDAAEARRHIADFIQARLRSVAAPEDIAAATATAMSLIENHVPEGEPPAHPYSVAALPHVQVSEPDADCSICLLDLPLASHAMRLPCSHIYHPWCITPWLRRHNSCPLCRSRLPVPENCRSDLLTTITIRLTTTTRRRIRVARGALSAEAPVSSSPTQLAQAGTGEGGGGPANSSDTVTSEWPPQPDSDTVMSEARDGDGDGFFDS